MNLPYGTARASLPAAGAPGHRLRRSRRNQGGNIWGP